MLDALEARDIHYVRSDEKQNVQLPSGFNRGDGVKWIDLQLPNPRGVCGAGGTGGTTAQALPMFSKLIRLGRPFMAKFGAHLVPNREAGMNSVAQIRIDKN